MCPARERDMRRTCVLVADSTEARIFTTEIGPGRGGKPSLQFVERKSFVHPEQKIPSHELFSGSRSDSRGRFTGNVYTLDDHREQQLRASALKFAALALRELSELLRSEGIDRVVLAAAPR